MSIGFEDILITASLHNWITGINVSIGLEKRTKRKEARLKLRRERVKELRRERVKELRREKVKEVMDRMCLIAYMIEY